MDELWDQTKSIYNPTDDKPAKKFTKQIAFNVIPHIDVFMDSGDTKEEWKMMVETKKIVDPKIKVTATCVRVPVFVATPNRSTSSSKSIWTRTRPATSCAKPPVSW